MGSSNYTDYTELELSEIVRIIKDVTTDDTAELKTELEKQLNKKLVLT